MNEVKSKTPTAQGISALLRKAGFDRAEYRKNWIAKAGYRATKAVRGEGVEVRHDFLPRQSSDARHAMLARYAEAITAGGWSVEVREYDLIVPAEPVIAKGGESMSTTADRLATIGRAMILIDTADPGDLDHWLAQTDLHAHVKADPALLREHLAYAADGTRPTFGPWKAAQQLLKAAGLPYMPGDSPAEPATAREA